VVADEVRKLAERAAGATKEIGNLIRGVQVGVDEAMQAMETSRHEAGEGAQRSEQAGSALTQMLRQRAKITALNLGSF